MAVIDEKGRVFGKLNIIDILAIVLIIAAAVVLVGKLLENRGGDITTMNVTYTVKVCNVDADVYRSIKAVALPDQLMAAGELLNGRVVSVSEAAAGDPVYQFSQNDEGVLEVTQGINETFDLIFTIEANVSNRISNELGTQEIRIGKDHIVKTSNFELEHGVILSCEWIDEAA